MAQQASSGGIQDAPGATFEDFVNRLEMLKIPTIARLHGGVYGGSTDMALACDFRVGVTPATVMFMPAARIGVHYYESGLRRYVSRLGFNDAKRLFMLAEQQSSEDLLRIGYLTDLVTPDQLDARIDAIAARLGELAPLAVQGAKRAINEIGHQALDVAGAGGADEGCEGQRGHQGRAHGLQGKAQAGFQRPLSRLPTKDREGPGRSVSPGSCI